MTQKLDWSKLGEMPPYPPTGPGRYLMRCGGVVEIDSNMASLTCECYWLKNGMYIRSRYTMFDIIAPAPDVLPWEECERLKGRSKQWRLLGFGEITQLGDEVLSSVGVTIGSSNTWTIINEDDIEKLVTNDDTLIRRRIDVPHDYDLLKQQCDEASKECERLKHELNAAVEHHGSYTNAIHKSLNCRRYSGSLLQSHLSSIELLKQQRDQYESELRAEQELNRKWATDYAAMKAECEQQVKQLEAERDAIQKEHDRLELQLRERIQRINDLAQKNHWAWIEDAENENYLQSLTCPVLIRAECLKKIISERDEWKRAAEVLGNDIKQLANSAETKQPSVDTQITDLQHRVAKLEQMQASPPMDCVANSTAFVRHDPESVHQAPDTEEVPIFKAGDVVYNKKAMWTGKVDKVSRSIKILISGDSHWRDESDFRHATPAERVQAEKEVV